jgi:hypothetical protein
MGTGAGSVYRSHAVAEAVGTRRRRRRRREADMDGVATRPGLGSQIWHFARHFLEMCAAMCIGGVILNGLLFVAGPALLGYGEDACCRCLQSRSP